MAKDEIDVDVLIVGAGPAGLMMACQLTLQNISFRIIDKKSSPVIHSGALIIHARTLEILDQMGLAEKAIEAGIIAKSINIQFNSKKYQAIDIKEFGNGLTRFPFFLMLEQWRTENLLIEFLKSKGVNIENNTEFVSLTNDNEHVSSEIRTANGQQEVVNSRFLIGADGSNSLVRKQLGIPFQGKTHQPRLFITDCEASLPLREHEVLFSFTSRYTLGIFPLQGNRWRIDGLIPFIQPKEDAGFEDVKNFFAIKTESGIELQNPQWFSVFRSHSRCASKFRQKQCFLVGDAAHVHSPVGAQGMNTGLQDSYNLAWKLAFYINGKANETLLDTYEAERRPLALNIIRYTDLAYSLMTSESYVTRFIRLRIVPFVLPLFLNSLKINKSMQKAVFKAISGIGIRYKYNLEKDHFPAHAPKPGERLPSIVFEHEYLNLFNSLNTKFYQLIVFGKSKLPESFQAVINENPEKISVIHIRKEPNTLQLFICFGIKDAGFYLVRPDLYIACRAHDFNTVDFGNFIRNY